MKLDSAFYAMPATELAPLLLGKLLCRQLDSGEVMRLRITETEAYYGEEDTACHAHKGRTERTKTMYQPGGVAYVYLCYGIHSLLNIVSGPLDCPQAVLLRGVQGLPGPGRLTKALSITRDLNGENLITSPRLWLEEDGTTCLWDTAKRVGIDYATPEYRDKLWRFIVRQEVSH